VGPGAARASCAPENLKAAAEDSDTGGMFKAVSLLPGLPGAVLEQLRLSLNTPVVALESLPVGPAAAAIALHRGPRAARLSLAVRATRGGQLLFFHPEGWAESELSEVVLDAALSFAEGMGFLFDEDLVGKGLDAGEGARVWADFLGDSAPDDRAWEATDEELAEGSEELAEGSEELAEGSEELAEGSEELAEGSEELAADHGEGLAAEGPEAAPEDRELRYSGPKLGKGAAGAPRSSGEAEATLLLLSKFRFLAAIPAEGLLCPPPPRPAERPARSHFLLRLLSRF